MTCIVGLKTPTTTLIGADSLGSNGLTKTVRADKKLFNKDKFTIGYTSSYRMGQLLQYNLTIPKHHPEQDTHEYMVTQFIEAVRRTLKDGGYATTRDGEENGGTFLIAYNKRLFTIHDDYQVAENTLPYDAIGSGTRFALGSLHSTQEEEPKTRIIKALEAAQAFSTTVQAPFHIEENK